MQEVFPQTAEQIQRWSAQPEVLGIIYVGSKSHNHGDELSDDDLEVVLTDEAHSKLAPSECIALLTEGEGAGLQIIYDAQYTRISELERKPLSPHDLDHWPYQRGRVLFDRDGRVSAAFEAAGKMSPEFRHARLLHATIDLGVACGRSRKTLKRGAEAAGRILIARGAKALARLAFGLEWRWVPLDHWLEAELKTLQDPAGVGKLLVEAVVSASPDPLVEALKRLEDSLFVEGIPRAAGRRDLFFDAIHPDRAAERAIHGLY